MKTPNPGAAAAIIYLTPEAGWLESVLMSDGIESRLKLVEELLAAMSERDTIDLTTEQMDDARVMALYTIVQELAENAGIPQEEFLRHYETRFRWWHDYYLVKAEDVNPQRAAAIDPRSIDESDVAPTYPPIFDSPPPAQS
jgi:hypothetical protein